MSYYPDDIDTDGQREAMNECGVCHNSPCICRQVYENNKHLLPKQRTESTKRQPGQFGFEERRALCRIMGITQWYENDGRQRSPYWLARWIAEADNSVLPERQKIVVAQRYDRKTMILTGGPKTFRAIAEDLHTTQARVRNLLAKALKIMARHAESQREQVCAHGFNPAKCGACTQGKAALDKILTPSCPACATNAPLREAAKELAEWVNEITKPGLLRSQRPSYKRARQLARIIRGEVG